ncbi:MAG: 1,4-beta-xylanase [Cytophagaceae bacterium]|nr:1,4-beta-xylanase [Cytophagaceae bacterium]
MKKTIFLLALICSVSSVFAQSGKVYDALTLPSKILNMERNYAIYLPPDYETSQRSYPVLYLLHGAGDNHTGWVQFGEVLRITDNAIHDGTATPMIIVMPDGDTGVRGYANTIDGKWNYEDFFFDEFMPFIEKKYRIKSEKRYRAVAGLSMGGGGTLMYALHQPDLFASACPLSAWVGSLTVEDLESRLARSQTKYNKSDLQPYFEKYNAVEMVNNMDPKKVGSVRWFIDCGDDDFLYEGNSMLHMAMRKKEIPHEYRVRDGAHNWTYWRESLPVVLQFVSDGFHQH